MQLAGNLSQLVEEGSQMCRQCNQGLPKEKMASDASQGATGRAWVLQLCCHADLVDLLFVACTVMWGGELMGVLCSYVGVSLVEQIN